MDDHDCNLAVLHKGGVVSWPCSRFLEVEARFEHVLVDVGTGDAKFPLRWAREHPDTLCIGIDPNAENMSETAKRASMKPTRGGVSNLVLVRAALEDIPDCLEGRADTVTVLYPWAGLLAAVVSGSPSAMARLSCLAKPGGRVRLLLNAHVIEWRQYAERLDLDVMEIDRLIDSLAEASARVGLELVRSHRIPPGEPPLPSTWGRRLSRASRRHTLDMEFVKAGSSTSRLPDR